MNKHIKNKETDLLFEHMLKLKTVEDYYAFFEDIATIQEIKEFTQRFHVARLLKQGTTYVEIERITKASATTISRVNKALQYGAGGYQKVLK
ncbi:YerC/YecD family TrpR-related protein [Liberiplasma polymorphum]|uniref:YerC/YecD family TrpR-related protein n=1 Tax=Liberiplasma polymorphum TaxID=3374570 RepID=UPI003772E246